MRTVGQCITVSPARLPNESSPRQVAPDNQVIRFVLGLMNAHIYFLLAALATASAPALAVNKCTGVDGKVTFQDAPCTGGKAERISAKPASGYSAAPATPAATPASAAGATAPKTEAARLEGLIAASQRDRRSHELRERLLPNAERAVSDHRTACADKQKALADQQYAYQQNLYGKTHAAQIASEMAASAATCETKARELKEAADVLTKECVAIRCRA